MGYWHNWAGWPLTLRLSEVDEAFDVINIAFATPVTPYEATMRFVPDANIYPEPDEFIEDVQLLQSQGRTVLISIGGANDPILIDEPGDVGAFVTSMAEILETYGFDGLDIDVEGGSLYIESGDNDFRHPTSPSIVYFIEAIDALLAECPDLILTAAPETAHVQGGYAVYGGVWGAYLSILHHFRDRLTYVHVQHYNTGTMYGRDGILYEPTTADFHAAMADMLLAGFPVDAWGADIYFDPLQENQVAIGLPAGPEAGGGYTPAPVVHEALDYVVLGIPFGGQYVLADPDGYLGFRGLMTWSINWDAYYGYEFSSAHRAYLDNLPSGSSVGQHDGDSAAPSLIAHGSSPNPVHASSVITYELRSPVNVILSVFDPEGRTVVILVDGDRDAGVHSVRFDMAGLRCGVYSYRLQAHHEIVTGKLCLVR